MEKISSIIMLVCLCVILLSFVMYVIFKAVKNKWLEKLSDTLKTSIREAESQYPSGHGEDKKKYVIAKIEEKCKELNIPVKMIATAISTLINNIVANYNIIKKSK